MEQEIETIYQEHSKTVYNYLFCSCHDKSLAEDLTQETFYIATKKIKEFRNECKISVWLCQIAKNLWYKENERMKKLMIVSMDAEIGELKSDVNIEEDLLEREQRARIYEEIEKLKSPIKELVYLNLTTELTFKEIAPIIGKSETWSRVTYYRWKRKMEEQNQKEESI